MARRHFFLSTRAGPQLISFLQKISPSFSVSTRNCMSQWQWSIRKGRTGKGYGDASRRNYSRRLSLTSLREESIFAGRP